MVAAVAAVAVVLGVGVAVAIAVAVAVAVAVACGGRGHIGSYRWEIMLFGHWLSLETELVGLWDLSIFLLVGLMAFGVIYVPVGWHVGLRGYLPSGLFSFLLVGMWAWRCCQYSKAA